MTKAAVPKDNLPATGQEDKTSIFALATLEDLKGYSFLDAGALDIIKENLGGQTIGQGDLERIKFPSSGTTFWQVPTLSGKMAPTEAITGIVLMQMQARVYWKSEYNGQNTPPDCSSKDCVVGTGRPGGACVTCPYSQWGSSPKADSDAQACKQVGILFVLQPGEVLPTVIPVPPTSLQNMKKFMLKLASKGVKYSHCILSFGLEEAKNKKGIAYSKIAPSVVSMLPDNAKAQIDNYIVSLRDSFSSVQVQQDEVAG